VPLLAVRAAVTKAIEEARKAGTVKQGTEARIVLSAEGDLGALLASRLADLPALFVVADVAIGDGGTESAVMPGLRVGVEPAMGGKCERCWLTRPLASHAGHPTLCARCAAVVG